MTSHGLRRKWWNEASIALAIVVFAIVWRWHDLGNPIAGVDEQFYLLVGDRMWAGVMPFVGIWDRKPFGLFLIYAAIRALPGDGVLAYQLVATACLAATGAVVAAIARRIAAVAAALAAGLLVVVYGAILGLGFGEAPIFYDLPVALAVLLIVSGNRSARQLAGAMGLLGTALTIKTSAAFEAAALGLMTLDWERRAGVAPARLALHALLYMAAGVAPMLAIGAGYAIAGQFDAFWFANVVSIFRKTGGGSASSIAALVASLLVLAPLIVPALPQARHLPASERPVLVAWLAGSVVEFASIGFFHLHYALPMVAPLAIIAARALERRGGQAVVAALVAVLLVVSVRADHGTARDRADLGALAAMIPTDVRRTCLFVYEGPTILYQQTGACLPGRYVFPGHFTDPAEANALERPSALLLRDVLARRPGAIVNIADLRAGGAATGNDQMLAAALARDYRLVGWQDIRLYGSRRVNALVWVPRQKKL